MKKLLHLLLNILATGMIAFGIFIGICLVLYAKKNNIWKDTRATIKQSMVGDAIIVESVSYDRYAYQQLDEEGQKTYDQVYDCIINFKSRITLSTKDKDKLAKAYEAVMADYGNLFWVNGYQYNTYTSNSKVIGLEFEPKYSMSKDQRDVYQATIDAVCEEWLSGISPEASDYDKALYVFETLINKVDYNNESIENQNILSVFIYKSTVCQGYADAAWYMLDKLGIRSTIITGTANNESHAWNLVYLDDAYYYMDVTWGNSKYLDSNNDTTGRINYAYFAMTTEEISQNHVITSSFEVPECLSNADNYFVHEGLYYDWFGVDSIGDKIKTSYDAGEDEISLKFSNTDLYVRVITYFFDEKHISDYCPDLSSVYYLLDEDSNVVTIKWN
ncbi:Transglutaminase-like superfamily protein [Pseudobutyrivibrio sp. OR37]|uniref:transglutaminase domain-containing protein n=1 Tax=Pseudobutyrivibrio sp. OR37 TaxID=1798186 RepID=UPI0008EFB6B6|nr:transglutaminase domain-containing protein [Pseudobutyrivibrio sp. OR37]SFH64820.1 Transglutaminase-like superfamily protein [Pseudobutyrivibrio sp. OR37]